MSNTAEKAEQQAGNGMSLYSMNDGDTLHLGTSAAYEVLRVPGGWIYTRFCENGTGGYDMSSCFVPFDNEFMDVD